MLLSADQMKRQQGYLCAMILLDTLLAKGIISDAEYNEGKALFEERYRPIIHAIT